MILTRNLTSLNIIYYLFFLLFLISFIFRNSVFVIIFSLIVILFSYIYAGLKFKKVVLIYFFPLFIFIPANYIAPLIRGVTFSFGTFYVYLSYALFFMVYILFYTKYYRLNLVNSFLAKWEKTLKVHEYKEIWLMGLFFLIGLLLYSKILFDFKSYLLQPRRIYELTRVGYGVFYFTSTAFILLAYVFCLFSKNKYLKVSIGVSTFLLFYFLGSKGLLLSILVYYYLFSILEKYQNNNFYLLTKIGVILGIYTFFLFYIYHILPSEPKKEKIISKNINFISNYSDYSRNAIFLIDNYDKSFKKFFYGKLLIEDTIYSRIPRFLYKNKPLDFGMFKISATIFPEWHSKHTGDPSFGIVGRPFADFGYFAIIYLVIIAAIKGALLGSLHFIYDSTQNKFMKIIYFIWMLYLLGIPIFTIGGVDPFIENLFLLPLIVISISFLLDRLNTMKNSYAIH